MSFQAKLDHLVTKNNSLVCIGLDSNFDNLPPHLKKKRHPQFTFNKAIIDATHDLVCAYKPNSAFYEAQGAQGVKELKLTCDYLRKKYLEIPIIIDAKRADIGSTNEGYTSYIFEYLGADAVTLQPYLGREALEPFLNRKDKGLIILCRTSNPGAGELQDLFLNKSQSPVALSGAEGAKGAKTFTGQPLWKIVAKNVKNKWNTNKNCLLVVGATYPHELKEIRKLMGDMTFLVPGIGAQGGDIKKTVLAGLNSKDRGLIINSSRSIIFASSGKNFAAAARQETENLRHEINKYR